MDWIDFGSVPWLGFLLATLSAFAVGGIWYMPQLFGTRWMGHVGLTPETAAASGKHSMPAPTAWRWMRRDASGLQTMVEVASSGSDRMARRIDESMSTPNR